MSARNELERYRKLAAELAAIRNDPREHERAQQLRDELQRIWWRMGPRARRAAPQVEG